MLKQNKIMFCCDTCAACICCIITGVIDRVESLVGRTREEVLEAVKQQAKTLAINKGADPDTLEVLLDFL